MLAENNKKNGHEMKNEIHRRAMERLVQLKKQEKLDCGSCPFNKECPFDHNPSLVQKILCNGVLEPILRAQENRIETPNLNVDGQEFKIEPFIFFTTIPQITKQSKLQ